GQVDSCARGSLHPLSMSGKAAFFDVDGTLVRTNIVHAFAYYALNDGSWAGAAVRTAATALSGPLLWSIDQVSRKGFNQFFYRYSSGMSEDRLRLLVGALFEALLKSSIFPGAYALMGEARRSGCRVVLCTGALDFSVEPLVRHFGADDLIANQM